MRENANYPQKQLSWLDEYTDFQSCWGFEFLYFAVFADNTANLTIKVFTSQSEKKPDFSIAVSKDNMYSAVSFVDLESFAWGISWNTGKSYWGTNDWVHQYKVNIDQAKWVGIKVVDYTAWDVTISTLFNNN